MATDAEKANTAMSNLTNGEPELSLHRDVGAASANIPDPDPLSRDTKENIDDKNSNSGAGDLLSRDNTGDLSDKKEENTAAGGDPLRGENPDKKEENNVGDVVDPLRGENSDDGGAGDTTEKVENKEETQEDEWEDILGNSLLKKKVIMRGSRRFCQRGSNFDVFFVLYFLVDEGREDQNTTISRPSSAHQGNSSVSLVCR